MGYLSPPPSPQPVIVYKDVGGLVSDYEAQTEAYRRENREVRLHECRSACTMALSLPNVCVYPDSQVKFHQAYNEITRETDFGVSARLFGSYPAAVQNRLGNLTRQYKVLSGAELIALGVRNCLQGERVLVAKKAPPARPAPAAAPVGPVVAAQDPLREIAQNMRLAVARAWSQPGDAPPRIVVPDRSPVPPAPVRAAALEIGASAAPLPPRRPSFVAVAAPTTLAAAPAALVNGAQPILDASHFVLSEDFAQNQAPDRQELAEANH